MTESDTKTYCLLWAEARDIAAKKGLKMSLTCPIEDDCKGKRCQIIKHGEKHGIIYQTIKKIGK